MKPISRGPEFSASVLLLTLSVRPVSSLPVSVPQFPHLHNGCRAQGREVRLSALLGS